MLTRTNNVYVDLPDDLTKGENNKEAKATITIKLVVPKSFEKKSNKFIDNLLDDYSKEFGKFIKKLVKKYEEEE